MGFFENDAEDIKYLVKKWQPSNPGLTEAEYEKELYEFLHKEAPKETFHRQYSIGKSKADIYVHIRHGAKVVIELKKDLTDRNEYHRLIGQVYEYLTECEVEVVVVACGKNDPALIKLTDKACGFFYEFTSRKAYFVEKRH